MSNPPNPPNPLDPMYVFIDTQPASEYPNSRDNTLSHFTTRQFAPENITATYPIVVTITDHGFQNGQGVRFTKFLEFEMGPEMPTGMVQLNNKIYYVQQSTPNTFKLYDNRGYGIDGSNFTPYIQGGQITLSGPTLPCVNPSHFPPRGVPNPF